MFYSLQSGELFVQHNEKNLFWRIALKRFLDVDHLLALCIQLPKVETVKTAESKITHVIYLKHVLELVDPLRTALEGSENPLLRGYCDVSCGTACALATHLFHVKWLYILALFIHTSFVLSNWMTWFCFPEL